MMPLHKLAAEILAWGILFGFSTLIFLMGGFPAIGAVLVFGWLLHDRLGMFKFVYDNTTVQDTRELYESGESEGGTEMGSDRQGSL